MIAEAQGSARYFRAFTATSPDETFTLDPCNLPLVFQGRDPNAHADYGRLPYRLGLITLQR